MQRKLKEARRFDAGDFYGLVSVTSDDNVGFESLHVIVDGAHPKKKILKGTRSYLVLEGDGIFTIDDIAYEVEIDDLYIIGEDSVYEYQGKMKLFEFNVCHTGVVESELID